MSFLSIFLNLDFFVPSVSELWLMGLCVKALAKPPRAPSVPINSLCMIFVVFVALRDYIWGIQAIR